MCAGLRVQRDYDARNLLLLLTKHGYLPGPRRGRLASLLAYAKYAYARWEHERDADCPDAADAVLEGVCDAVRRRLGAHRPGPRPGRTAARPVRVAAAADPPAGPSGCAGPLASGGRRVRLLFLKRSLRWPRSSGARRSHLRDGSGAGRAGARDRPGAGRPPARGSFAGLPLEAGLHALERPDLPPRGRPAEKLAYLQRRFLRFWGIAPAWLDATADLVRATRPDVVVAAGLEMLPCLAAVRGPVRVWYAADEYATHQLSMFRLTASAAGGSLRRRRWPRSTNARTLVSMTAPGSFPRPRRGPFGSSARAKAADVAANGVDGERFCPGNEPKIPGSCAFWGRLDAGPNIEAVQWFCRRVWPKVRSRFPDASLALLALPPLPRCERWPAMASKLSPMHRTFAH